MAGSVFTLDHRFTGFGEVVVEAESSSALYLVGWATERLSP